MRLSGADSCSVADAAAAPSFASARRREAALPAQTVTAALCNLRSVSQWVRRVYIPHPRRETDRSLSSPATAVCIPHVCESRPHATRCACAVHGMKCGWRAARVSALHRDRRQFRGSMGSDGFVKVLIGTRGAREAFLDGWKGRAARTASDWAHLLTFVDLFAFHPFRPLHPLHPLVACSVLFPCLGSLAHSMLIRTPTACRSESEHLDGQKTCTIRAHAKSA